MPADCCTLGKGATPTCRWLGVEVAVKELHGTNSVQNNAEMFGEAETLNSLRHPCIIAFYGIVVNQVSTPSILAFSLTAPAMLCLHILYVHQDLHACCNCQPCSGAMFCMPVLALTMCCMCGNDLGHALHAFWCLCLAALNHALGDVLLACCWLGSSCAGRVATW